MILYFSGTGNSQFVAKDISNSLKDEMISINYYLKKDKLGSFKSESPFVFILPTYAWRIPKIVKEWMLKSSFKGNKDCYFILTCGGGVGNAGKYAEKLCKKIGLNFKGLAPLIMPENYLALFPTPDSNESKLIIKKAKANIDNLVEKIKSNESFSEKESSFKNKILSGPINLIFYPFIVKDKGFTVDDSCISCGKCSENCPLNNIEMVNGKPNWLGSCTHCMACIASCPTEAIEYKDVSKNRHRHYIMDESIVYKERILYD